MPIFGPQHCQVVMGPAGVGKSTYCHIMQQHCQAKGISMSDFTPGGKKSFRRETK